MDDWGVERGEHVTGAYAATAAPGADSFGLVALRQGRVARAFVAVGTLSVALLYTAPFARALLSHPPARIHALQPVVAPTLQFPMLKVPAPLTVQPSTMKAPIATHTAPRTAHRTQQRVPIVTGQVNLAPASSKSAARTVATPPSPPIVDSSVGVEPAGFGVGAASTDVPAPATTATADPAATAPNPGDNALTPNPGDNALTVQSAPKAASPAAHRTSCSCAPANTRLLANSTIANSTPPAPQITLSAPPLPASDPPAVTTTETDSDSHSHRPGPGDDLRTAASAVVHSHDHHDRRRPRRSSGDDRRLPDRLDGVRHPGHVGRPRRGDDT